MKHWRILLLVAITVTSLLITLGEIGSSRERSQKDSGQSMGDIRSDRSEVVDDNADDERESRFRPAARKSFSAPIIQAGVSIPKPYTRNRKVDLQRLIDNFPAHYEPYAAELDQSQVKSLQDMLGQLALVEKWTNIAHLIARTGDKEAAAERLLEFINHPVELTGLSSNTSYEILWSRLESLSFLGYVDTTASRDFLLQAYHSPSEIVPVRELKTFGERDEIRGGLMDFRIENVALGRVIRSLLIMDHKTYISMIETDLNHLVDRRRMLRDDGTGYGGTAANQEYWMATDRLNCYVNELIERDLRHQFGEQTIAGMDFEEYVDLYTSRMGSYKHINF